MAICLTVQKWKHYALGRHFVIRTDQQSLRYLTQQRETGADCQNSKVVRKLIGFNFEIHYKPGTANRVADALSRKGEGEWEWGALEVGALITSQGIEWKELDDEAKKDPLLQKLRSLEEGQTVAGFLVGRRTSPS